MESKELTIQSLKEKGGSFLVKIKEYDSDVKTLFAYLKQNDYQMIPYLTALPRGEWIYINMVTKTFRYGTIGIAVIPEVIGNHTISVDDFITIANIYKKYENLPFICIK